MLPDDQPVQTSSYPHTSVPNTINEHLSTETTTIHYIIIFSDKEQNSTLHLYPCRAFSLFVTCIYDICFDLPVGFLIKGLQCGSGKRKLSPSPIMHSLSKRDGRHTSGHNFCRKNGRTLLQQETTLH